MKTTNATTAQFEQELKEMSKRDLIMVKTSIALFGVVLNICVLQLFLY